jgi:hypothetical protein
MKEELTKISTRMVNGTIVSNASDKIDAYNCQLLNKINYLVKEFNSSNCKETYQSSTPILSDQYNNSNSLTSSNNNVKPMALNSVNVVPYQWNKTIPQMFELWFHGGENVGPYCKLNTKLMSPTEKTYRSKTNIIINDICKQMIQDSPNLFSNQEDIAKAKS